MSENDELFAMTDKWAKTSIEDRLAGVVRDEHGQPLVCYGCAHAAAYMEWTDGRVVPGTDFPGRPSGERPCCFCVRNPEREKWANESAKHGLPPVDVWYDGSAPVSVPMDCYHSFDMLRQIEMWTKGRVVHVARPSQFFSNVSYRKTQCSKGHPGESQP